MYPQVAHSYFLGMSLIIWALTSGCIGGIRFSPKYWKTPFINSIKCIQNTKSYLDAVFSSQMDIVSDMTLHEMSTYFTNVSRSPMVALHMGSQRRKTGFVSTNSALVFSRLESYHLGFDIRMYWRYSPF